MHDIRWIRENPDAFDRGLARRGLAAQSAALIALDGGVAAIIGGEADIGLYPLSEIVSEKGVTVVGLIPPEIQLNTVYAAGVLAANPSPEPAISFANFLADPANAKHWRDGGFEPANGR